MSDELNAEREKEMKKNNTSEKNRTFIINATPLWSSGEAKHGSETFHYKPVMLSRAK